MALAKLTADLSFIEKLANQPNEAGMTAQQLKQEFDKSGLTIKEYLNNILIPEIESAIGAGTVGDISGSKLIDLTVTTAKLAALCIVTEKLANGAVTTEKLADSAVTGDKISNGSVDAASKIFGILPVANGGTGTTTVEAFRQSLGVFSIANGGTGATTALGARNNLLIDYGDELPATGVQGEIFFKKVN